MTEKDILLGFYSGRGTISPDCDRGGQNVRFGSGDCLDSGDTFPLKGRSMRQFFLMPMSQIFVLICILFVQASACQAADDAKKEAAVESDAAAKDDEQSEDSQKKSVKKERSPKKLSEPDPASLGQILGMAAAAFVITAVIMWFVFTRGRHNKRQDDLRHRAKGDEPEVHFEDGGSGAPPIGPPQE